MSYIPAWYLLSDDGDLQGKDWATGVGSNWKW